MKGLRVESLAVGFVEILEISLSYSDLDCSFSTSTFSPSRCNEKLLRSTYYAFETTAVLFTFNALRRGVPVEGHCGG